jgi:hypothetical protein
MDELAMDELEPEPEETSTGDARVDEALRGLDPLAELEVAEHPAVFERIHGHLAEVLSELRTGPHDAGRAAG